VVSGQLDNPHRRSLLYLIIPIQLIDGPVKFLKSSPNFGCQTRAVGLR
jgi:hypothetical protein